MQCKESIIKNQPDWVELVTWNDYGESYICPVDDAGKYVPRMKYAPKPCHAGYLEINKYYIQWYKNGHPSPVERDGLVYVYRLHPKDATPTLADLDLAPSDMRKLLMSPVAENNGRVEDAIYLTTFLTAPADVKVTSGTTTSVHRMPAGVGQLKVPFSTGDQYFEVLRDGKQLIHLKGEPIESAPKWYNFFSTTGFAYAQ